jgi:hypothetical protein
LGYRGDDGFVGLSEKGFLPEALDQRMSIVSLQSTQFMVTIGDWQYS